MHTYFWILVCPKYNFIEEDVLLLSFPLLPQVLHSLCRLYYPYYDPFLVRSAAIEAEITASRLRRSRIEADIAVESSLRRSRI